MEFKSIIINAFLIGLFVVSLVSFSVTYSAEHNSNISLLSSQEMNKSFGSLSTELNESRAKADEQMKLFKDEGRNPILSTIQFIFTSIMSAGNIFMTIVVGIFTSIIGLAVEIFHVSPLVTGTLFTMLLVILILAAWRLYKTG